MDYNKMKKEEQKKRSQQVPLQLNLNAEEKLVLNLFSEKATLHIDEMCHHSQMPVGKLSGLLLQLEFSNLIKSRPGKLYERI